LNGCEYDICCRNIIRVKKILRKLLKISLWTLGILIVVGAVGYIALDKRLPEGKEGAEAEALTDKMFAALNKPAWDSLGFLQWTYFKGGQQFFWDKKRNLVEAKWSANRVLLDPSEMTGIAYEKGEKQTGEKADKLVQKGLTLFWNDGFWLYSPFKVRDAGTTRKLVENADGSKSLLVTYGNGGRTPGDHYLWHLNAEGIPTGWQMWVKVFPIGGLRLGWTDWQTLPGGAKISATRTSALKDLRMTNIKGGNSLQDFGLQTDPFAELLSK
jgi:hypothetical protein